MDNVIYLDNFPLAQANESKLAKIGEVKLNTLREKYRLLNKKAEHKEVIIEKEAEKPIIERPIIAPSQVSPNKEEKPVIATPAQSLKNNFDEIIATYGMTVYQSNFTSTTLMGARKVRTTASRILPPIRKFTSLKAVAPLAEEVKVEETTLPVIEEAPELPVVNKETIKPSDKVEPLPSVDDYLQKANGVHQDTSIKGVINKLEGDIEYLKTEADLKREELNRLEEKYRDIQVRKQARIEELQQEKLSYTTTLDGLTQKIREMQEAIAQEENSLSGYKKAA